MFAMQIMRIILEKEEEFHVGDQVMLSAKNLALKTR